MDTFLQNTIRLQQALHQIPHHIHHRLLYTFSAIFTGLAQDSKVDGGNLNIHWTTNLLWYKRNNHILIVSSGDAKTSDRLSYLTMQPQGSLRELTTHFRNLSVYCKPLNNALTYPSCVDIWNRKSVRRTGNDNELTLVDGEWVAKYSVQTQSHRRNVAHCFCNETENDQLIDLSIYLSINNSSCFYILCICFKRTVSVNAVVEWRGERVDLHGLKICKCSDFHR